MRGEPHSGRWRLQSKVGVLAGRFDGVRPGRRPRHGTCACRRRHLLSHIRSPRRRDLAEQHRQHGRIAAIDRLVHHATIFEMNVESDRRRTALASAISLHDTGDVADDTDPQNKEPAIPSSDTDT